ncbi:MAG: DUF222 domain-containing protein [Antricoccus sp.]
MNPDGFTEPDDLTERRAFVELKKRTHGGYRINGLLTDQVGAKLQTMLHSLASAATDGSRCSAGKRAHDALGEAADRLLKSGELPTKNGATARVLVTVSLDNLLSGQGEGWTDHGDYLPVSVIRKLAADAGIIPIVLGGNGEILDVGRERRFATAPITWALTARDGGCTFPAATSQLRNRSVITHHDGTNTVRRLPGQ